MTAVEKVLLENQQVIMQVLLSQQMTTMSRNGLNKQLSKTRFYLNIEDEKLLTKSK
jgi:hypothetical protein